MKKYLDRKSLLDYLRARVEIGECVVNDDLIDEKTRDKNATVVFDRKNLVTIVESMETEDPYAKIIDRLDELIFYYRNWWGYDTSTYVRGQIFAYKDILNFVKKLSEEKEDENL